MSTISASVLSHSVNIESVAAPSTFGARRVAATFADAFAEYPLLDWALGASGSGPYKRYQLFRFLLDGFAFPFGAVYRTRLNEGAAVWMRSEKLPEVDDETCAQLTQGLRDTFGFRGTKGLLAIDSGMKRHHLNQPHLYLYLLGVRRDFQRRGIGTRLLRAGLGFADEAQLPVFLETSSERAANFYSRFDFKVMAEYFVTPKSPKTWTMLRLPQAPE